MITLYHHPFTRAANVVWMLEELGAPYELEFVDIQKGAHKAPEHLARSSMGKLPVIQDSGAFIAETSAIGVYLADKYSSGELAPKLDAPERGKYLEYCFYGPSVVEVGCYAKKAKWEFGEATAGWGSWDAMMKTLTDAVRGGPYLLGEQFTMADCVLGGTLNFMLQFKMIDEAPELLKYSEAIKARAAYQRAQKVNGTVVKERDLKMPG